jgi:hypothetical protein
MWNVPGEAAFDYAQASGLVDYAQQSGWQNIIFAQVL